MPRLRVEDGWEVPGRTHRAYWAAPAREIRKGVLGPIPARRDAAVESLGQGAAGEMSWEFCRELVLGFGAAAGGFILGGGGERHGQLAWGCVEGTCV